MKSAEFLAIIAANANKTKNLRSYFGSWPSSISRVPDEIAGKIGRLVAFVQAQIEEGHFCDKKTEYLLIYNFQPLHLSLDNIIVYYALDLLRKPISKIKCVKEKIGEPIQLVIKGTTGEVVNNSQFMVDVGLATIGEIAKDKLEPPTIYGNYRNYPAHCCFLTIVSDNLLSVASLFKGGYDENITIQEAKTFENLLDACRVLEESKAVGRYIAEIPETEDEIPRLKKQGLCVEAVKLIDYVAKTVIVNTNPRMLCKEEPIEDELSRLQDAFGIVEIPLLKANRIAIARNLYPTEEDKSDTCANPALEETNSSPSSLVVSANAASELSGSHSTDTVLSSGTSLVDAFTETEASTIIAGTAVEGGGAVDDLSSLAHSLVFFSPTVTSASPTASLPIKKDQILRILIVEDNVINQKMLLRMLKPAGHTCHVANDGLEALAAYDQFMFDIIFMDIVMPNMDGLTATQEIRKREKEKNLPRTPIIAITANTLEKDRQKGQEAGIDEYISKPFLRSEIYALLATLEGGKVVVKKKALSSS